MKQLKKYKQNLKIVGNSVYSYTHTLPRLSAMNYTKFHGM